MFQIPLINKHAHRHKGNVETIGKKGGPMAKDTVKGTLWHTASK